MISAILHIFMFYTQCRWDRVVATRIGTFAPHSTSTPKQAKEPTFLRATKTNL
jgi:hypothetical protein